MGMELMGLGYNNITGNKITTDAEYGIGIGLLAGSRGNLIDYNTIISTGTKTGTKNYNDLLDFENTGIAMGPVDEYGNSGTNYIRYNNITVKGEYTISLKNTTSNSVHHNNLLAKELQGDESVYTNASSNTIRDNTPKIETSDIIYVSNKGSDSNKGTKTSPLATITTALKRVNNNGEIIILDNIGATGIEISKSITIGGINPDVAINGNGKDIFYINSEISGVEKVIIHDLTFFNCSVQGGSVILSFAPELYLYNLTLYNNTDESTTSGFYGPISNYGNLYVDNCLFYDNRGNSGGAIYSTGNLTVTNSIFHDNTANKHGGAIAMGQSGYDATNLKIINSTFYNNKANNYGGAIFAQMSYITMNHSVFENNKANAGGFYYGFGDMYTSTNIQYSIIYNNTSPYGDIYTYRQNLRANYNWWGDNSGSANRYDYSDGYPVTMDLSKPVIMTLNINETIPDSVPTTITANLNKYLYGSTLLDLPDTIPTRNAIFASTSGVFSQTNVPTTKGTASSQYTGRSEGELSVTIDEQTIKLNTTVTTKDVTLKLNNTNFKSSELVSPVIIVTDSNNYPVATGILTVTFNSEEYYASVNNGIAKVDFGTLSIGEYTFDALYTPIDNRYNTTTNTFTFTVNQSITPVPVPIDPVNPNTTNKTIRLTLAEENITGFAGDNITVSVNVISDDGIVNEGNVEVTINNKTYQAKVEEGMAFVIIELPETPDNYPITIKYINNTISATMTSDITVNENINTTGETLLNINFQETDKEQKILGTLTDTNGKPLDGNINITLTRLSNQASKTYTVPTNNGKYELNLNLAPGDYSAQAQYFGNEEYLESATETLLVTITGKEQNAIINDENQITETYGEKINYNGTLTDNEGNKLVGYHIAVNITRLSSGASKTYYLTTDYNGEFTLPINLAPGEYTLHTSINDKNYTATSLTNLKITRNTTETKIETQDILIHYNAGESFTGKLTDNNGNIIAGQHIDLTLSNTKGQSKTYDVVTDYTGTFTLPINLAPGTYKAQTSYKGTSTYSSISTTNTITVQ